MKTDILRNVVLGAIVAICTGSLFIGSQAEASETVFQMQTTERAMYGTEQIDTGEFGDGADRLETMLDLAGSARQLRAPALNDLCVAYTMLKDFEVARERCNDNVANGRDLGRALNNRGVLRIATGDYDGAVRDFNAALEAGGVSGIAAANLELAQQRMAELRQVEGDERTADNDDIQPAERPGDERAAVIDALTGRFMRLIEAETQQFATRHFSAARG